MESTSRYAEMSQGDLTVTGDAVEVSIALTHATSTPAEWRPAADLAAVALGYTLTDYDRFGYLLKFGYPGQGSSGGATGVGPGSWFYAVGNTYISEYKVNHEFGHTLGIDNDDRPHGVHSGKTPLEGLQEKLR